MYNRFLLPIVLPNKSFENSFLYLPSKFEIEIEIKSKTDKKWILLKFYFDHHRFYYDQNRIQNTSILLYNMAILDFMWIFLKFCKSKFRI